MDHARGAEAQEREVQSHLAPSSMQREAKRDLVCFDGEHNTRCSAGGKAKGKKGGEREYERRADTVVIRIKLLWPNVWG
jgi:hypothetical protein